MEELKRCPFCDSLPECGVRFYKNQGSKVHLEAVVKCPKCGCEKHVIFKASDYCGPIPFFAYEKAFEEVKDKWNMRAGS